MCGRNCADACVSRKSSRFSKSAGTRERYDIIFADPPYEKTKSGGEFTRLLLENANLAALLESDGLFILEKRPEEKLFSSALWKVVRAKTYGATEVLFLEHAASAEGALAAAE